MPGHGDNAHEERPDAISRPDEWDATPMIGTKRSYVLDRRWLTEKLARTNGPDWVKAHRGLLDDQWEQGMALGLTLSDAEFLQRATPEQLAWAKGLMAQRRPHNDTKTLGPEEANAD